MPKQKIKMKNIIAFAGSNSKYSINKKLATYASSFIEYHDVTILDLNDYELPLYGIDLEKEKGIPENAHKFLDQIKSSDALIVSLAEHNGAYSTVFKNLFDWMSRIEKNVWMDKPMLLMAAAPGGRGGKSVLEIAQGKFPRMGANITGVFSLPFFQQNFSEDKIIDEDLNSELKIAVREFQSKLN